MIIKVAVCDDNASHAEAIAGLAGKIMFSRTEYEFTVFRDGREVVNAIDRGVFDYDLLFLDIHMKNVDGMQTAAYIRERRVDVDIIFTTVSQTHVYEGYTYRAFAYILKPIREEIFRREVNRYLDEKEKCSESLNVNIRGTLHRIPLDGIVYFESDVRKILIHTRDGGELQFYGKMNDVEQMLQEKGFVRCHQSYIVNRRYVVAVSRTAVELKNTALPISRKYWEVMKQNQDF